MKPFRALSALLVVGAVVHAQDAAPAQPIVPPVPNAGAAGAPVSARRTAEELEQLVAPIALYPDALIAIILPASTAPTDVVLAARYVRDNPGDRSQIENRGWDDSVKSLTSYPEVLKWMDENLQWTQQLGDAFAQQPADVMEAVQRLRARARAAGTLVDTPQQQVIAEPQVIRIVPAQPDIIYVPAYEPDVVFVDRPIYYGRPFLSFGFGVPVGAWLAFECDWHRHTIWVGNRHRRWTGHDWHQPVVPIGPGYTATRTPEVRQWRPPQPPRTTVAITQPYRAGIVRPAPFSFSNPQPGTSSRSPIVANSQRDLTRPPSSPQPVISSPAQTSQPISHSYRRDFVGPRPAPDAATPPQTAVTNTPPTTAPTVGPNLQPLPTARRSGGDTTHDNNDSRTRWHGAPANAAAALPTVPSLPMSTPPQSASAATPASPRSYSYTHSAPSGPPPEPATNRSYHPPASVAPAAPPPAVVQPAQSAQATPQQGNNPSNPSRGSNNSRGGRDDALR